MSLVYFSFGTVRFWLDSERGNSFLSQKAVPVLGGLQPVIKAEVFSSEGHGLAVAGEGEKYQRARGKGKRKEIKISLLVLTRYKLLIRNISAARPITTLTQLGLWWRRMYQKIYGELWGLCPSVLSPNPLPARVTQKYFNSSFHLVLAFFFFFLIYFKVFLWKRLPWGSGKLMQALYFLKG